MSLYAPHIQNELKYEFKNRYLDVKNIKVKTLGRVILISDVKFLLDVNCKNYDKIKELVEDKVSLFIKKMYKDYKYVNTDHIHIEF